MKQIKPFLFFILCCIFLSSASLSFAEEFTREETLILGRVSTNPVKHIKNLQPMVEYASSKMKHAGIKKGEVVFAKDNRQMIQLIKRGEIDWITETPFSATYFIQKAKAQPILLRWKKGVQKYSTIFFTRKDSDIKSVTDLKGKKIAFEDPGSTSGFFLPFGVILQQGLTTTELASPREQPPENMVGYTFSKNEINTTNWVTHKIIDAGVISNLDWIEPDRVPEKMKEQLVIFHETDPVPRAIELIGPHVKQQTKDALIQILTTAHEDETAANALKNYKSTKQFDKLDQEMAASLNNIKELKELIDQEY